MYIDGSVLSICREFSNAVRVVVDGANSEWIPIVLGVSEGSVFGPLLFILYTNETFELVEKDYKHLIDYSGVVKSLVQDTNSPKIKALVGADPGL